MLEDYTDPDSIDVDVVRGNINQAFKVRGHLWGKEPMWPNVTVLALAQHIDSLESALNDVLVEANTLECN